MNSSQRFLKKLNRAVGDYKPTIFVNEGKLKAAVLVPLVLSSEPSVLLTLRASHLKSHPGQVSFPGGMFEAADQGISKAAALRETEEEIGLSANKFNIVSELSTTMSKDGVLVYPVLATIESATEATASPDETADIFTVPWQFFVDNPPQFESLDRQGVAIKVPHYQYEGRHIWGLTAMILLEIINLVEGTQWTTPNFIDMS